MHIAQEIQIEEYSKMKVTFSYKAGYGWRVGFVDKNENRQYIGSSIRCEDVSSPYNDYPRTSHVFDIPKVDCNVSFCSSSLNGKLYVYEVLLLKE